MPDITCGRRRCTTDGEGMGKMASEKTMMVGAMAAEMTLLERYDDGDDGWIQLEEARVAVGDYFGPPKGSRTQP